MQCDRCNTTIVKPADSCGTGYGTDPKTGAVHCYQCCACLDRETMQRDGKISLYLTQSTEGKWEVTNWPGTLRFPATVRKSRHNFGAERRDAYFCGPNGSQWWGFQCSDWGQNINVRRINT